MNRWFYYESYFYIDDKNDVVILGINDRNHVHYGGMFNSRVSEYKANLRDTLIKIGHPYYECLFRWGKYYYFDHDGIKHYFTRKDTATIRTYYTRSWRHLSMDYVGTVLSWQDYEWFIEDVKCGWYP